MSAESPDTAADQQAASKAPAAGDLVSVTCQLCGKSMPYTVFGYSLPGSDRGLQVVCGVLLLEPFVQMCNGSQKGKA